MTRPRRGRLALLLSLLALVLGVVLAPTAMAQDEDEGGPPTYVRGIDATNPEEIVLQMVYGGDDLPDVEISSDEDVEVGEPSLFTENDTPVGLAVVLDTGSSMDESGALQSARDGLLELIDTKPDGMEIAIVSAADTADLVVNFTSNTERLRSAVEGLGPSPRGNTALWAAVETAAGILDATRDDQQPNLMVITAGSDTASATSQGAATAKAQSSGAAAWIISGGGASSGALQNLAATNGGTASGFSAAGDVPDQITTVGDWLVENQWVIPFVPEQTSGVVPLDLQVGDADLETAYTAGQFPQGKQELAPSEAGGSGVFSFLTGAVAKWLGLLMFVVAAVGVAYGIFLLVTRDEGALSNVLQPYAEDYVEGAGEEETGLARSALIQRAVEVTEQVAENRGYLSRTEAALERANLPLRAGEALFFYVSVVAIITLIMLVLSGSLLVGLVIGIIVALIPPAIVSFLAGQRRRKFLGQLPDTLQLLAGTLRAGYSLMQGVEAVSQEVAEPMGKELRRVVTESRLGRPLEESLDSVAQRMASPDFAWAVMAIRIQREVGGNLSELLLTVAETMTARERLRRDISALTAEGRISAIVLGILPVGLGFAMYVLNPDYISRLFETTLGNILLGLAIVGMGVGFAWMRQIIKIEI